MKKSLVFAMWLALGVSVATAFLMSLLDVPAEALGPTAL